MSSPSMWTRFAPLALFLLLFAPSFVSASSDHGAGFSDALVALALICVAARVGADLAVRVGQPAVLGELVAGVLLGNMHLASLPSLGWIAEDPTIRALAELGVILLLFEVGLESTVRQMMRVGTSALVVALLGVVTPFLLGWAIGAWLIPEAGIYAHAFLGATLAATSVGITARVMKDLGRSQSNEARIIMGAAVIDDVLGLVMLAVVTGVIQSADSGTTLSMVETLLIVGKAAGFLVGSLLLGTWLSPRLFRAAAKARGHGVQLAFGLSFCFLLSWASNAMGLAPIVGAFAAGLILEEAHFVDFKSHGEKPLEELLHPLTSFLVPVFFVVMGLRTDLRAFVAPGVLALASALTFVAILGKQACSFGVIGTPANRITVGIGMIPRGEVGLIFANIGLGLSIGGRSVITPHVFSAIVVMVIVTTVITPPLLKWSFGRDARRSNQRVA